MRLPIRISVSVTFCWRTRSEIALNAVSAKTIATNVRIHVCIGLTQLQSLSLLTMIVRLAPGRAVTYSRCTSDKRIRPSQCSDKLDTRKTLGRSRGISLVVADVRLADR